MPVLAGIGGALVVALAIVIGVWQARRPSAPTTQKETTAQPPAQPTAQAPPTPKPVAEVQIESQPADAELFLNGEALGVRTPTSLPADRVAGAEVRASKPGFEPAAVRVTRADIDRGRISLALVAEVPPTVVTGRAEFPFEVLRGSTVVSQRSDSHRFTVRGEQTLRISAPQVFLDRVVTVAPGRGTFNLNVPPLGRLSVRTAPSLERCRVSVGGLDFGTPPYPPIQYQPIVAGTHRVSLTCPDGSTRQELVVVEAARDRSVVIR
jgi:hypothetical protein